MAVRNPRSHCLDWSEHVGFFIGTAVLQRFGFSPSTTSLPRSLVALPVTGLPDLSMPATLPGAPALPRHRHRPQAGAFTSPDWPGLRLTQPISVGRLWPPARASCKPLHEHKDLAPGKAQVLRKIQLKKASAPLWSRTVEHAWVGQAGFRVRYPTAKAFHGSEVSRTGPFTELQGTAACQAHRCEANSSHIRAVPASGCA